MSSAATAAFNDEQIAEAFLERLKVGVPATEAITAHCVTE